MAWQELLQQWEERIRRAEIGDVKGQLEAISLAELPRKYLEPVANVFRRTGLSRRAIEAFSPFVHNEASIEPLTDSEWIEYCMNLMAVGLSTEANYHLENVNVDRYPVVHLYKAGCLIGGWDYAGAIPHLELYVKSQVEDPYQQTVGKVNLAAAFVAEGEFERASALIEKIIERSQQSDWRRLQINCYELMAQIACERQEWTSARQLLELQRQLLTGEDSPENLFSKKLEVVVESNLSRDLAPLREFRELALEKKYPELVRYADYQLLKLGDQERSIEYLYHGTPYLSFRQKLKKEFPSIGDHYLINGPSKSILDLESGTFQNSVVAKPGQALHRLIIALTDDFYRPPSIEVLFSQIYEDDFFDIAHSPNRIHQLLSRCRSWIAAEELSIKIVQQSETYSLIPMGKLAVRKTELAASAKSQHVLLALQNHFPGREFSANEAATRLGLSKRYSVILLGREVASGNVRKKGIGRSTKYQLTVQD